MFRGRVDVPVEPAFEHAVVPIGDPLKVDDAIVEHGSLAYVPTGYDAVPIETRNGTSRFLLLAGAPLAPRIDMHGEPARVVADGDAVDGMDQRLGAVVRADPDHDAPADPVARAPAQDRCVPTVVTAAGMPQRKRAKSGDGGARIE